MKTTNRKFKITNIKEDGDFLVFGLSTRIPKTNIGYERCNDILTFKKELINGIKVNGMEIGHFIEFTEDDFSIFENAEKNLEHDAIVEGFKQSFEKKILNNIVPPQPLEDTNITNNVDEWIACVKEIKKACLDPVDINVHYQIDQSYKSPINLHLDFEIIENAEAFALGPVFAYDGKAQSASNNVFKSLDELKEFLNGKNYVLYMVFSRIKTHKWDQNLFNFVQLKEPEVEYTFRGTILP